MRHRTVRFRSSSLHLPDTLSDAFSSDVHHHAFSTQQLRAIWSRFLKPAPGGLLPSSIQLRKFPCVRDTPQFKIFTRSRRRLEKTKRCPAKASSCITLVTSACSPSKLQRISHGVMHRYTRTLAGK